MTSENSKKPYASLRHFFLLSVVILMVAIFAGCTSQQPSNSTPTPTQIAASTPAPTQILSGASPTAEIKTGDDQIKATIAAALADGTYSEDATYAYHSGQETVTFSVTVKDGILTAVLVTPHNPAPMSAKIISKFSDALPSLVVGKKIDEISLPKNVAGSSLTSAAFVQYLNKLLAK
jgi:uncharacterized protein with FMN-binding domain